MRKLAPLLALALTAILLGLFQGYGADANLTPSAWAQEETPEITVSRTSMAVWGPFWDPELPVTVTLNGGDPRDAEFGPTGSWGVWDFPTVPGDEVVATNGITTRTLIITSVEVTVVDLVTDTISGVGDPGSVIQVLVPSSDPDSIEERDVTVGGDGTWNADLSDAVNITAGMGGAVDHHDDDGDATRWEWRVPNGDVDCDGDVDSVDGLKVQRYVAGLPVNKTEPCPDIGSPEASIFGDVDCDNDIDAVDALKILRIVVGLPAIQKEPCPDVGWPP